MRIKSRAFIYAALIAGLAFYLRFRFVLYAPFDMKIDAWSMYNYALNVVKGEYYGHQFGEHWARYAYWPPLYIFLSGFVYKFFGTADDFFMMRLLQVGFSTASCLLAYLIAAEALKSYSSYYREAGLIAGLLTAINPKMVVYTNHLYVETVFITIYLTVAYYALLYIKHELPVKLKRQGSGYLRHKYLLLYSVALGFGNLTRPVLLLIPGVMIVFILLHAAFRKNAMKNAIRTIAVDTALTLTVMLLVISPWAIRNYAVTGRFILIDTNGPINFYMAHNELANGQWVDVKPHTDIDQLYETGYGEGLKFIRENLGREWELIKLKQDFYLNKGDFHITEAEPYIDRTYRLPLYGTLSKTGIAKNSFFDRIYRIPEVSFGFLWKTALVLFVLFTLKLLCLRCLNVLFSEPAWIIGNILYINLIILIFYFAPRYRIGVEPFLSILTAVLLAGLVSPSAGIREGVKD